MRELDATTVSGLDIAAVVRVLEQAPVTLGILYGSYARGEATPRSDIDLAVEFDQSLASVERTRARLSLIERLSTELDTDDVDVVPLSRAPDELLETILTDGVLVIGSLADVEAYRRPSSVPPDRQDRLAAFDAVLDELERVV